ncbi:hypothetical protein [Psychrobacillus sp. L4]
MPRKYIRFNYFEIQLVPADVAIREELNNEGNEMREDGPAAAWDMSDLLD